MASSRPLPRLFGTFASAFRRHASSQSACWSCGYNKGPNLPAPSCLRCRMPQPVSRDAKATRQVPDYHAILGAAPSGAHELTGRELWRINKRHLRDEYIRQQRLVHPDGFVTKGEPAISYAASQSALIAAAYEVLKGDISRGKHILALFGTDCSGKHNHTPPEILMWVADAHEYLSEATTPGQVMQIKSDAQGKLDATIKELEDAIAALPAAAKAERDIICPRLRAACRALAHARYYTRVIKDAEEVLLRLECNE